MAKLKPCPQCGSKNAQLFNYFVKCEDCSWSTDLTSWKKDTPREARLRDALKEKKQKVTELKKSLAAAESRVDELETYASNLIYALTDGKLSKLYDIPVIESEVNDLWQRYVMDKTCKINSENRSLSEENEKLRKVRNAAQVILNLDRSLQPVSGSQYHQALLCLQRTLQDTEDKD